MNIPTVSIVMITYGHEKYIKQAIEGVFMQVCNFEIELIIANDGSPDDTDKVILDLLSQHPKSFSVNYIKREKNWGMMPNFVDALRKAKGKYIALCEGDDFWTDSAKLQRQVDFLDVNPSFAICFHRVDVLYEKGIDPFLPDININTPEVTTIFDLLRGNYLHTASVMFRNNNDYPSWLNNSYPGDWPLHVINSTYGKIKFMDQCMASYRVHYGGVHSTTGGFVEKSLGTFHQICEELAKRNLKLEAKNARKHYRNAYAVFYALHNESTIKLNRVKKSLLLLKMGEPKHKLLSWLPLIFGNSALSVYNSLMKLNKKYIHGIQ